MTHLFAMTPGDLQGDAYYLPLQHVRPDFLFWVKPSREQCAPPPPPGECERCGPAVLGTVSPQDTGPWLETLSAFLFVPSVSYVMKLEQL